MKTINKFKILSYLAVLFTSITFTSCSDDDDSNGGTTDAPDEVNEVEVITNVTLMFTNTNDASDVVTATATDPDGEGIQELQIGGPITLKPSTEYTLTYTIENALDPSDVEDIVAEILEEDNEHQLFFSFSENAFSNPIGNGNIDNASDPLNYNDMDENDLPVGLSTSWTTPATTLADGNFTVKLQHQPAVDGVAVKTSTSTSEDGDTDFDLTFVLNIEEPQVTAPVTGK